MITNYNYLKEALLKADKHKTEDIYLLAIEGDSDIILKESKNFHITNAVVTFYSKYTNRINSKSIYLTPNKKSHFVRINNLPYYLEDFKSS
jgi:hypothetical protein